jgi:hypothetical protein
MHTSAVQITEHKKTMQKGNVKAMNICAAKRMSMHSAKNRNLRLPQFLLNFSVGARCRNFFHSLAMRQREENQEQCCGISTAQDFEYEVASCCNPQNKVYT